MCEWLAVDVMSCFLSDQQRLYDELLKKPERRDDAQKFFAWGSPDLLVISRLSDMEAAKRVYHRHTNPRIFDRQVYFGHVIGGTNSPLQSITDRLPLVGVSFLKLKDYVIRKLPDNRLGFAAYDWLRDRMENCVWEEVERSLPQCPRRDFEYIVCAATGWADAIVVSFSNSYAPIQLTLSHLRRTTVRSLLAHYDVDVAEGENIPNHAFITTCTIPGTHIDYSDEPGGRREDIAARRLHQKLAAWDHSVQAVVSVHAKPGHLNDAMDCFAPSDSDRVCPTFGRTDFMVMAEEDQGTPLVEHHAFFVEHLLPKVKSTAASIGWTETRLRFAGAEFRAEPGPPPRPNSALQSKGSSLYVAAWNDKRYSTMIPAHTGAALRQIGLSLAGLVQHEATTEFYDSLAVCYQTARQNGEEFAEELEGGGNPAATEYFAENMQQLCERLDLCFKDRYRGSYPAGSMSAVPSLTSQASFHKALDLVDALANVILNTIQELLWSEQVHAPGETCKRRFAACCHLGNSCVPQAEVLPHLGVGFLNVPTDLMFAPEGIAYIVHETGHVFWSSVFPRSDPELRKALAELPDDRIRLANQVLCDFCSLSVVFCGDWRRMQKEFTSLLQALVPSDRYPSMQIEMHFRSVCAATLYAAVSDGNEPQAEMAASLRSAGERAKASQVEDEKLWHEFVELMINVFCKMMKSPSFVKMLRAIQALATPADIQDLSRMRRAALEAVQDYFAGAEGRPNPEEFTYTLWQLLRRERGAQP